MNPTFAYAQARIQAHHGQRPNAGHWQRLEAVAGYPLFLKQAREPPLSPWLQNIAAEPEVHLLEQHLRKSFSQYIAQVASWLPGPWQPAVLWLNRLHTLPARQYQLEGNPPHPGFSEQPLPPLDGPWRADTPLDRAWLDHWQDLWPSSPAPWTRGRDKLVRLLQEHRQRFSSLETAETARKARETLTRQLEIGFRHHAGQPAAVFIHLALTALMVERLRGGLVRRCLFHPRDATP